ncbi:MAG: UDP-N-acetylglucosamine 1-carboxyvinyltransferase [Gammaproteobacteria bacterium]
MDKLLIEGQQSLTGSVKISGAKNSVLPMLCASVMVSNGSVELENIPHLQDVTTTTRLLTQMGVSVTMDELMHISLDSSTIHTLYAPYELVKTMRSSILVLGPLLSRFGEAKVSLPGGCAIGMRPVDMHLSALEKMGATISVEGGYVSAKAHRLKGANIVFPSKSVTGTENVIMAATLAEGKTVIENCACEPEISDLCDFLIKMGAKISGHGTNKITVEGVNKLKGTTHKPLPDRIEAGTFMVAAAITKGDVEIRNIIPSHSKAVIDKLTESGVDIKVLKNSVRIKMKKRPKAVNIETNAYPLFPTDMQAQMTALNCLASGESIVKENIFENRFMHAQELLRMGAKIKIRENTAEITGIQELNGAPVMATDLRASASLILAGLAAKGTTEIGRVYHIDRGYDCIEEKLQLIGARISRKPM